MYITGSAFEVYRRSRILMNGCKYLTPNGKSLTHLYAKSMHKLRPKSASFIMFKRQSLKTTVSIDASWVFESSKSTGARSPYAHSR